MNEKIASEESDRVRQLEEQVKRLQSERDRYREMMLSLADVVCPIDPNWQPPPPGEGVLLSDVLRELEGGRP